MPDTPASRITSSMADNPKFAPILQIYVEKIPAVIAAIEKARQHDHREDLGIEVHRLKGTAASYGFPQIGEAADRCMQILRRQLAEPLDPALDRLLSLLRAASPVSAGDGE